MDIKRFQGERKLTVQIPVQNEDGEGVEALAIWYRPITPALLSELTDATERSHEKLARDLAMILTRWELTDGGNETRPTENLLRELPMDALAAISGAITQSIYPNSTT